MHNNDWKQNHNIQHNLEIRPVLEQKIYWRYFNFCFNNMITKDIFSETLPFVTFLIFRHFSDTEINDISDDVFKKMITEYEQHSERMKRVHLDTSKAN